MKSYKITAFIVLLILIGQLSFSQCTTTGGELVTNGGFETCSPSPCSGVSVSSNQTES